MADGGALPRCMPDGWQRVAATATFGGETWTYRAWATGRVDLRLEPVLIVKRPFWRRLFGLPSKATVHVQPRIIMREPCRVTPPLLVKGRFDG